MEDPHLSSGMTASTHIWAAESNPESLHHNAVHLHLSLTSPSITKRGENLISRWQLHCMFGQINPTQNIPDERSRRMLGLFYSSPSGLTAVKFCVLEIGFDWNTRKKFHFFLEVRTLLLKRRNASSSSMSEWPKCPCSQWVFLTTQICSQPKSASILKLWILLSWQDLILILKYVSWTLKFMFSLLIFLFFFQYLLFSLH